MDVERSPGQRVGGGAACILAMTMLGGPATAQEVPEPVPSDTVVVDSPRVLAHPNILVRTFRTPLSVADLPFAVTVRRPSAGVPTPATSLDRELAAVPGLQVHNRHNDALGDRIVMRGFGARAQFGVRGIQLVVDGVPATMPDGQATLNHLDLAVLDRAEVLRGPAAAAYGNAAGGVILLHTLPPPATSFLQEAAVTAGGDGLLRLRSTSGGSGEAGGWIATLSSHRGDGFRPHSDHRRYHLSGRADAPLWGGHARLVAHGVTYDAENPGALTWDQYTAEPHQAQAANVGQATGEEGMHGQLGLTWERPFERAHLETVVYGLGRSLENPIPPTIIDLDRLAGGTRLLLRGGGGATGAASWAVGVDAAVQRDERLNFENDEGRKGTLTLEQDERVTNLAAHAQGMVPLADRFAVFVGARYDRVTFSADDHLVGEGDPDDSGRRAMHAFSPTAGVRLEVTSDVAIFGNVSTAFETPTTTELVNRPDGSGGFNQELEPQRTVSYEVGARAGLGSVALQASAYRARVEDGLVPFEVASAPGRQFFRNAAVTLHRGLEFVAELATGPVDLLASYSRTRAEFSSYATDERSYDGLTVPGVRPWTVGIRLSARPLAPFRVEVDYEQAGAMVVDDANEERAPGHALVAVRASATALRLGGIELEPYLGVDNLLDDRYVASVVPNAFGGRYFEPGPGRALYLGTELRLPVDGR